MKRTILRECIRLAKANNTEKRHPEFFNFMHFSFIIERNKIVEWGVNREGPRLPGYPPISKIHAEADSYRKARGRLETDNFECVNIRLNKAGDFRNSFPCKCCVAHLKTNGCQIIYFTTEIGFAKIKL